MILDFICCTQDTGNISEVGGIKYDNVIMHAEVTICEHMSVFALILSSLGRQKKSGNKIKQGVMENASLSITKIIIKHLKA